MNSNRKLLIILIGSVLLISCLPISRLKTQVSEGPGFDIKEKMAFMQGNTLLPVSNPSGPEAKVASKVPVIVTAYSSSVWETDNDPFITAAGTWVRDGIIANNLLPFGTKVRLPELYGEKIFVVEDRMSWKKGNYHFDIWFPSYSEAKNFGAQRTYIEILES